MKESSVWKRAQTLELQVAEKILPEFSIGFDKRIPKETEIELRAFIAWMESNYRIRDKRKNQSNKTNIQLVCLFDLSNNACIQNPPTK